MAEADLNTPPVAAIVPPAVPPADTPPAPNAGLLDREPVPPAPAPAATALPDWMNDFPDALKAEKTLEAFAGKTPADLAQALVETKKMVGDRVPLPKADDPDSFLRFAAAVRPENADAYTIDLPDGTDPAFADTMRPAFHDAGLLPWQAEKLVAANNAYVEKMQADMEAAGTEAVEKLKTEMGVDNYERSKQAAVSLLTRLGIPASFDSDMARFIGGENSLRYFFALAQSAGEMGKIHDTDVALSLGSMTAEMASAEANKMVADPKMAALLRNPASAESIRLEKYSQIIANGAANRS